MKCIKTCDKNNLYKFNIVMYTLLLHPCFRQRSYMYKLIFNKTQITYTNSSMFKSDISLECNCFLWNTKWNFYLKSYLFHTHFRSIPPDNPHYSYPWLCHKIYKSDYNALYSHIRKIQLDTQISQWQYKTNIFISLKTIDKNIFNYISIMNINYKPITIENHILIIMFT